jgi:dolichyl-diphosphooligosaccharide---protein glycosyltransferase
MSETSGKAKNVKKQTSYVGVSSLIIFAVLLMCWIAGFASRLFAVIRFESIIHEFDPW